MNELSKAIKEWVAPWFLGNAAIEAYKDLDDYIVLDFETTNKSKGHAVDPENRLVLACWTVVTGGFERDKYAFGDEYDMKELVEDIKKAKFVVAHNAKFEAQWLYRCGVDLHDMLVYDTMSAEWVIHGNLKVPYNLEDTGRRRKLGGKESIVSKMIKLGICPSEIPQSWLLKYCRQDVHLCHQIFLQQAQELEDLELWHIMLQRNLVIPVLADIELQGLQLDEEAVNEEYETLTERVNELGKDLDGITGGINLGSPKQLGTFLYDVLKFSEARDNAGNVIKTGTGRRSASVKSIDRLVASTELQLKFLELYKEYNKLHTLLTKNLRFFKLICEERGGVFYGSLNHCRAANHRLASSGIGIKFKKEKKELSAQLQNLPRQYKKLFTAHEDGWVCTEYDGSQIEFRVGGDISNDQNIESDIVNGVDIHSRTRDTMNAAYKRYQIQKEIDRQDAKPNTFAPMYGSAGKDAAEQEYVATWRTAYPKLFEEQTDWTLMVADQKKLRTKYGLIFYWPDAKIYKSGYIKRTTEIFNLPISGFATGEIIPIALVYFWHRVKGLNVQIFNTVHDSICVRQPEGQVEETTAIAKQAMTLDVYKFLDDVYGYKFHVPLGFGMKSSKNWGTSKSEHKWDVWRDGSERYQIEENKVTRVVHDTRPQQETASV